MKVVIVGGVAGGASAAARIRRLDEHAQIVMIERSGYVSYANCGLPYYVGGVIVDRDELTLQTPESFWDRFRIDVRVRQEVTAIDPEGKTVTVHALDSGKFYTETYDKLILAPGAKPTVPALSGVDSERVFTLRTVEDTLRIRRFIEEEKPKTTVLAGGGFIGLEMAENLAEMGIAVTIVQRPKQLLAPLDADMASFVHAEMRRHGVALRLGETVTGFRQDGDSVLTLLEESEPLHSDMVLLAIGVTPDTHLAKEAGLELGIRDSIAVNERMETSVPDIYAVGDAVEVTHFVTGQKALISLAGPANKQGRIAADNICGGNSHFTGSQGSSVLKLFGLTAASTGINEKNRKGGGRRLREDHPSHGLSRLLLSRRAVHGHQGAVRKGNFAAAGSADRGPRGCRQAYRRAGHRHPRRYDGAGADWSWTLPTRRPIPPPRIRPTWRAL